MCLFGKGGRLIQGLIVGLVDEEAEDLVVHIGELKDIAEVLDLGRFSMRRQLWLAGPICCWSVLFL